MTSSVKTRSASLRVNGAVPAAKRARTSATAEEKDGEGSSSKGNKASKASREQKGQDDVALPMGKLLASTEKKVRDGAVQSIAQFLSQTGAEPLSEMDMRKLWKGIFYCFWMSDKPLVQQALAQELADLVLVIGAAKGQGHGKTKTASKSKTATSLQKDASAQIEPAICFLEGFLDAMVREWHGLDKWRVPKFYLLIRRFINAGFRLLRREGWPLEATERVGAMLGKPGGALCANDVKVPDGVTYHMCDIYMDELDKVASSDDEAETAGATIPVIALLRPFIDLAAKTQSSIVYDRIMSAVLGPWLDALLEAQLGTDKDAEAGELSAVVNKSVHGSGDGTQVAALRKATFSHLFKAASAAEANDARRRRIYKLCKEEEERLEEEEE